MHWLSALRPFDWNKIVSFVDALADLAAYYWSSPDFNAGGDLEWVLHSYEKEAADYIDRYLEPENWERFMALARCTCLPRALHDRGRMRGAIDALKDKLAAQTMTLSHGDVHPGNLYINSDGTPGFLDAQPRRAPWGKGF